LSDELVIEVHVMLGDNSDGSKDNVTELELQTQDRTKLDLFEKRVKDCESGKCKGNVDEVRNFWTELNKTT